MSDFTALAIDEMEAIYAGGFKRARAALGVTAFGLSVSDLPPGFDRVPPHVHSFDGQEEIYVALSGDGWLEIGDERVALDAETIVRVGPGAVRRPIAGPNGLRLLSASGVPGGTYEPFPNSIAGNPEMPIPELPGVQAAQGATSDNDYTALPIAEIDVYAGVFFRARRSLGVSSFGMAVIDLEPDSDFHPLHNEVASGQEEVYTPLRGSGEIEIDGERVPLPAGTMVRVAPSAQRRIFPGSNGLRVLAIGGTPGAVYDPATAPRVARGD